MRCCLVATTQRYKSLTEFAIFSVESDICLGKRYALRGVKNWDLCHIADDAKTYRQYKNTAYLETGMPFFTFISSFVAEC